MGLTVACRDLGTDCDYVASGKSKEELITDINKHGKDSHGFTDESLKDPDLVKLIDSKIKNE